MPPCLLILQYDDNVPGNGTNYGDAYFEINYIRAYTSNNITASPSSSASGSASTATGSNVPGSDSVILAIPLVGTIIVSFAGLAILFML